MPEVSAKEQFDRQAVHYDKQWNSWSEETLDWLIAAADTKPTDKALDIATGAGFTACALSPLVSDVTAIDVSSGMLDQARTRAGADGLANIEFIESSAEKLPFANSSFDIVSCRIAAHHFLDVNAFVAESARVLKSGGRFLLVDTTVPNDNIEFAQWQNETEEIRDRSHIKNLSQNEWCKMVEDAGLTIVEATTAGQGITIELDDWLRKSGTPNREASQVRERFANAPHDVCQAFKITQNDGKYQFTWMRLLLKAVKPTAYETT
jgi:ubiquinone/menaquinone biosynthesis C-methylase UbiE